jgi:hypothetical protein
MATVITSKTAAEDFYFSAEARFPATIHCKGLAGAETIAIKIKTGSTYTAIADRDGVAITLTATKTIFTLQASGEFLISKPITAGAVEVYVSI